MENCTCPIACNESSYVPAMSYAALSTISVKGLLRQNTSKLARKFRYANEIRERVVSEDLIQTLSHVKDIYLKLKVKYNLLKMSLRFLYL